MPASDASSPPADRPALTPAFDALGLPFHRPRRAMWLPFAAIVTLALLISALFVAVLIEDRQLQREALQRDFDSAAQQLGARLRRLEDTASVLAFEIGNGSFDARRFAGFGTELAASHPEVQRLEYVGTDSRLLWPAAPGVPPRRHAGDEVEDSVAPLLARATDAAVALWESIDDDTPSPRLILALPVYADRQAAGALLLYVPLRELLLAGVAADRRELFRLSLLKEGRTLASTSVTRPPPRAPAFAAALPPLPPALTLQATAFRLPSHLISGGMLWATGGLALAVVVALAALLRYTTQLVRADSALMAETSLRRAMEQSLATGLCVLDAQGTIRHINRAFGEMTGWREPDLVGRGPPYPYWPPEAVDQHRLRLARLLAGDIDPAGQELEVLRADGTRFDAHLFVSPLVDDSGAQIGWVSSLADVSEAKRIRNQLAVEQERVATVLESLEAAVSVLAPDAGGADELLFANRAYRQAFGDSVDGHRRLAAARVPQAGGAMEVQDPAAGRWYDLRTREIRWADGRAARLQIATDITLRKTTEEIVRQQQEKVQFTSRLTTMGEMASSLAHEINQPLTAISNYTEGALVRLRAGLASVDELAPVLEKTSSQAQRAGRVIRRIREFVKRSTPRRRPTPAARIIEDAVAFAEIDARKHDISIATAIDPALPPLDVDPILIEQVLLNLLKNAVEAMTTARHRRIDVVAVRADANMAQISVIDRGSGIADEHLGQLFQPFFSTKSEGMGMGLALCRSIIEFHRGRLSALPNPEPGGGAILRFTLPLAAGATGENARTDPADAGHPSQETAQP